MPGPHPAVAATRVAVRPHLRSLAPGTLVLVGLSGGPDSLSLAAAVAFEAPRAGVRAGSVVVDHGLQDGSPAVAASAAAAAGLLGLDPVEVVAVDVRPSPAGPEADARAARHTALSDAAERLGAARVLLGHTLDDQAEQVLLGLARGSGARSLSGMPAERGLLLRPFLSVRRAETLAACAALGLQPWHDPHNSDPRYARASARQALAHLESALGPGLAEALARSAALLRTDADHLDELARAAFDELSPVRDGTAVRVEVDGIGQLAPAVRARVWRLLARAAGASTPDLGARHVAAMDALLTRWRGQGPVHVPGGIEVRRAGAHIDLRAPGSRRPTGGGGVEWDGGRRAHG